MLGEKKKSQENQLARQIIKQFFAELLINVDLEMVNKLSGRISTKSLQSYQYENHVK